MLNFFINDNDNKKLDWLNKKDQDSDASDKKDTTKTTNSLFDPKENTSTSKNFDFNINTATNNNDLSKASLFSNKDVKNNTKEVSNPFNISIQTKSTVDDKTPAKVDTQLNINSPEAKKESSTITEQMDKLTNGKFSKLTPLEQSQEIAKLAEAGKLAPQGKDNKVVNVPNQIKSVLVQTKNNNETIIVTNSIKHLSRNNQFQTIQMAITIEDKEKQDLVQKTIANDLSNYDKTVQVDATKAIVDTKNVDAVKIAAAQVSKLDATRENKTSNQVEAVKLLENSELDDKDQKAIDKTIIDQYAQIDKASQLDVHKTMSASKLDDSVQYAASNIWHMDKTNQAAAVDTTIATGNEEAINNASEQYSKYDDSAKDDIKSSIESTDYTEAKNNVESYQDTDDNDNNVDTNTRNDINDNDNDKTTNTSDYENDADTNYQDCDIEEIQNQISQTGGNQQQILDIISDLSDAQKIELLQQNPTSDVVNAILNSHPTLAVLEKIDPQTLKALGFKNLGSLICFLSIDGQKALVEQAAENGNLSGINRDYLLAPIKTEYDRLKKEMKDKNSKQSHNNNKLEITA